MVANGYGKQELYHLKLAFSEAGKESDTRELRFGIREITYELSLFDSGGHLRRVEVDPVLAKQGMAGILDVTHEGMREIPPAEPMPHFFPRKFSPLLALMGFIAGARAPNLLRGARAAKR